MDRLRAAILIAHARVEREILRRRIARLEKEHNPMAGEIRTKMAELRAARQKLITDVSKEIDSVIEEVHAARADGLEASKLPRAELDSIKQEVREIRAEFSPATNGAPAGPLPGTPQPLSAPSPGSAAAPGASLAQEPNASWAGGNK